MKGLLDRDRLHKGLRVLVGLSALIVYMSFMVVFSVIALLEGGAEAGDWKDGWFGYLLFYVFVLPFFLIQATHFVFCKVSGIEVDFDARMLLYISLAPLVGILIAFIKAENLGEATYVGLFMCVLVGGLCVLVWNLAYLGRMIWDWLSARWRRTRQ